MASPSTPPSVRNKFLEKAEQGEKITHKTITQVLKAEKNSSPLKKGQIISPTSPKILQVIPKDRVGLKLEKNQIFQPQRSSDSVTTQTQIELKLGCWYLFDQINLLFCGDTSLPEFCRQCSQASLAIAITSDDWDHDWLIEKASNLILLQEAYLKKGLIQKIISHLSAEGDTVILPWLPDEEILALTHRLKRRIVAGDPSLKRCQKAIIKVGLPVEQVKFSQR